MSASSRFDLDTRAPSALRREALAFVWVGGLGFVTDAGLTLALSTFADVPAVIARIPATSIAIGVTFLLNRFWTFRSSDRNIAREFARYVGVSLAGALLSYICYAIALIAGAKLNALNPLSAQSILLAIVVGAAVAALFNFFGSRYFAFVRRASADVVRASQE